jgi:endo-1,4-beta-xylanase
MHLHRTARHRDRSILFAAALAGVALVAAACSESADAPPAATSDPVVTESTAVPPANCSTTGGCSLRDAAELADVIVGAAVAPERLDDPDYARTVAEEFTSLTPENHMKWPLVHPTPDEWDFAGADRLVAFAEEHGLAVKGHTLIWGQAVGNGVPEWVMAINDPAELQSVVDDHIATLVGRYAGRIDRWDVVNEPLLTLGAELDPNHFHDVLGADYIADAFRAAHDADPEAKLFLNEHSVETIPAKADALVALVEQLVADGVPIHGVGLQAHQFTGAAPEPGVFEELVATFTAMGLDVAITELDVPLNANGDVELQADVYAQIVRECLAASCSEITVWGVDDSSTWLDGFLGRENTAPLLFDDAFARKATHQVVVEALLAAAPA